jgi:rhodanese-related sulfurtransferase
MSIREITVDDLDQALAAGARLIDVREANEYDEAHVPGAVLVALSTLPDHIDAFVGDEPPLLICRSGARSMRACEYLAQHGIQAVNVYGGTIAWLSSGRFTVSGPNPT